MRRESMNVIALEKHGERYVFLFDDKSFDAAVETFWKFAKDPELSFNWYDAAVLRKRAKDLRNISPQK